MNDLIQMTESDLERLREVNLEMAEFICDFCKKNNLRIYLYAGSLLGAVRHHGFIPWDDDVDMVMPAPDYKKFLELWKDTDQYSLCSPTRKNNDKHLSTTIRDNYTTFIVENAVDMDTNQGVGIDLGPLHAAAKTKPGRIFQLICAAGSSLFKAGRIPNRRSLPWKIGAKIILGVIRGDGVRYFLWSNLEKLASIPDKNYDSAKYVKELGLPPYMFWLFPKEWFDEAEWVPFENTIFPIPKGAKGYLEKRYGDYMELPPEEERRPAHKVVFMDLDTPYKEYRGIKYFVKEE